MWFAGGNRRRSGWSLGARRPRSLAANTTGAFWMKCHTNFPWKVSRQSFIQIIHPTSVLGHPVQLHNHAEFHLLHGDSSTYGTQTDWTILPGMKDCQEENAEGKARGIYMSWWDKLSYCSPMNITRKLCKTWRLVDMYKVAKNSRWIHSAMVGQFIEALLR